MKKLRRILALMMALILALSMTAVTVSAEGEYTPTNLYALNFNGEYSGAKWQYFSPYWPEYTFDGALDDTTSIAFTLYNTNGGNHFPVYCTDLETGLDNDSNFRRINLEDSTYAGGAAGLLRSIVLNGFPWTDVEALGAAAGVENLTVGEAVAATQAAIWSAAHGNRLVFTDFCSFIDVEWNPDATEHYAKCYAEIENKYAVAANEALIEEHIAAVYGYLLSLEPTSQQAEAVSEASFKSWSDAPTLTKNENGSYNVTVEATVDVSGGSDMKLTAYMAGHTNYYAQVTLNNDSNTLTIQNVPAEIANGDVKLAIDGYQTVSDVFLFDAEGGRGTSQSLIGKDASTLPVHAEITVETERVINITKTTNSGTALEGIIFDFYQVAELSEYLSGEVTLPKPENYSYSGLADYTIITDEYGRGSFSLTKNGMSDGVYLVVERPHPAISAPVAPFYVIIPATSSDGSTLVYEINVSPKNIVKGGPSIEKDVTMLGNDSSTYDAYETHTWIISATIPTDMTNGKKYVISDTLNKKLDYVGNVKVRVESNGGEIVRSELVKDTDYTLTVIDNNSLDADKGYPSDSFEVALTPAGMQKVARSAANSTDVVRVYFDAKINANATMGENIPNQAKIEYTNSVGVDFDSMSDQPEVHTGGTNILKIDAGNESKKLAGAEFEVYAPVVTASVEENETAEEETADEVETAAEEDTTEAEGNDQETAEGQPDDEQKTYLTIDGNQVEVVKVTFFDNVAMTGDRVSKVVTNENGQAVIYGLAYGTYYLVETKAPAGYNLLEGPVQLTINETSHTNDQVMVIKNAAGTILPETGGMGTTVIYAAGLALIGAAVAMLLMKKRGTC